MSRNFFKSSFSILFLIGIFLIGGYRTEENGTRHYSIVDIINLKDTIDCKAINRQVEELSFEEEE